MNTQAIVDMLSVVIERLKAHQLFTQSKMVPTHTPNDGLLQQETTKLHAIADNAIALAREHAAPQAPIQLVPADSPLPITPDTPGSVFITPAAPAQDISGGIVSAESAGQASSLPVLNTAAELPVKEETKAPLTTAEFSIPSTETPPPSSGIP